MSIEQSKCDTWVKYIFSTCIGYACGNTLSFTLIYISLKMSYIVYSSGYHQFIAKRLWYYPTNLCAIVWISFHDQKCHFHSITCHLRFFQLPTLVQRIRISYLISTVHGHAKMNKQTAMQIMQRILSKYCKICQAKLFRLLVEYHGFSHHAIHGFP